MAAEPSLETLRRRARDCTACDLYKRATQTVFGTGPASARLMLLGEQPGDREDLEGRPFVGPAGQMLDKALALAGIDRRNCYLTNVVKHFKWEPRGRRRLHKTPAQREIDACRQWLIGESRHCSRKPSSASAPRPRQCRSWARSGHSLGTAGTSAVGGASCASGNAAHGAEQVQRAIGAAMCGWGS